MHDLFADASPNQKPIAPRERLAPETFRTSRLLDFASQRELTAQIGHPPSLWPMVAVKELVDNALDATEQIEAPPELAVTVTPTSIEVADNGPGLSGDVVDDVLDFTVRVSSREACVGPTRGAQGNALKTLMVMPFVLDGNAGRVEVESLGVHHRIDLAIDRIAQEPKAAVQRGPSLVKNGTVVRLHWPDSASDLIARRHLAALAERIEREADTIDLGNLLPSVVDRLRARPDLPWDDALHDVVHERLASDPCSRRDPEARP
jgi:hypothetical protein